MTGAITQMADGPVEEKQPPGIYLLFLVEMWERFSYYGMRALLVLYLVDSQHGGMGWDRAPAQRLYGWYGFFAYVLPVLGGAAADRWLGTRRSILIGGLIIAAGHFCLAAPVPGAFFAGIVLVVVGTGLFKPNMSTMVGQLYRERDPRRDPGFTIYYMGVNTGALLGPLLCGYLAESSRWGWHYGFGAAGVGMLLGLACYLALRKRYLAGIGLPPGRSAPAPEAVAADAPRLTREERDRIVALGVIFFFVIFFWMGFEQAGSSMNLFAAERTDRALLGHVVPASWFQSLNPVFILLLGPVFAWLWKRLARRGREPSTPIKMAAGLVFVALGFVFMVAGARRNEAGLVSPMWLVAAYFFHTVGELCVSPIGLSLVTRLAPVRLGALFMGLWFLATGIAELVAGQLAALSDRIARGELFHVFGGMADFYLVFVGAPFVAAVMLFFCARWLRRLMRGRDVL